MRHNKHQIHGRLAQLGERLPYKQNVGSSILSSPTKIRRHHVIDLCDAFFFCFFVGGRRLTSYPTCHLTSLHRSSLNFARRSAPSKSVRFRTSSFLLSPTKIRRHHVIDLRDAFFFCFFVGGRRLTSYPTCHLTSLHRSSLNFARRSAPSKSVRFRTSSFLLSPTKSKDTM